MSKLPIRRDMWPWAEERMDEEECSGLGVATGAGPSFALMHRLNPGHRNGVALGYQIRVELLGCRHPLRPRITLFQQRRCVVDCEVSRHHSVEVVPGHRKRDGHAGSDPWTVRGNHRGAAGTCRVEEDLAFPVLLDEGGCCQVRIDPLGAYGHGSGHRSRILW